MCTFTIPVKEIERISIAMSSEKNQANALNERLNELALNAKKEETNEVNQPQPALPHSSSHSQISGDIQARLVAFQQKRSKPVHSSPQVALQSDSEKPLPPLPQVPSRARSQSVNCVSDVSFATAEFSSPTHNSTDTSPSVSGVSSPGLTRLHGSMKSPLQQPMELLKRPSLSQRRGMKLNLNEMNSSPDDSPKNMISPVSLNDNSSKPTPTSLNLSRKSSERRKPNFKLNLGDPPLASNLSDRDTSNPPSRLSSQASSTSTSETLSDNSKAGKKPQLQGLFANYSKYVDIKSGSLNFAGKASLHSKGVDFLSGSSFRISLEDMEFLEELGHGNYGVVLKVLHKPTGVLMAMKEVRLELDETKFTQILMELEILHKCDSPYIVDFYGAFFVEGAVYMCMEYMDGGSLDKVYRQDEGVKNEACLAYISECIIRGLKELKDKHNIIHRDVKPTNILVNTLGKVKLCDFGVSGNLVASLAKTNIGCQSYMAPERIKSLNPADNTYSVQSDIWSLGLTILEIASGHYPYPPETYGNIFSQLSAIVDGEPPKLDPAYFSKDAQLFIKSCLNKKPDFRPSYATLLSHPWLMKYRDVDPHMDDFVTERVRELEEEKSKRNLSRSNSSKQPSAKVPQRENVRSLLKNKVKPPALHRGNLMNTNRSFINH